MSNIQSLERGISILSCLSHHKQLSITEIGQLLNINKSTAFNLAQTLVNTGFLEQDEYSKKYSLGLELFRIGSQYKNSLRDICLPYIRHLAILTNETVNLVNRMGNNAVYIEKIESAHSMRICTEIGQRYPLHCSAAGKAILAFLNTAMQEELLQTIEFTRFTSHTITNLPTLRQQLKLIKTQGHAEDIEELEYGLICVAVPLFDSNADPVAAISVSGPLLRMDVQQRQRILQQLHEQAQKIMANLR